MKAKVFAGVAEAVIRYIDPTIKKIQLDLDETKRELAAVKEETRYLSRCIDKLEQS